MIYIQNEKFRIDLSANGVSLTEKNDIFTDSVNKNYSLPFTIEADEEILEKLDLPTLQNIRNINTRISCLLCVPDRQFRAVLYLGDIVKNTIECTLTYGDAELPVYNVALKDLPWPIQLTQNLADLAEQKISQSWPATGYNFPMVYKPSIDGDSGYEYFEGFVNHWKDGAFVENEIDDTGDEDVYLNKNVMVPMPYFLEIIKVGYKAAGIKAVGEIFNHPTIQKLLYIPNEYLELFDGNQYQQFSFSYRTSAILSGGNQFNVYENSFTPQEEGTYNITYKINLPPSLASTFILQFFREDALSGDRELIQEFISYNNRVDLDEKLDIIVEAANVSDPIVTVLKLPYGDVNISEYNNFEIQFSGGQLNVFPNVFTLSDFMPDMTFGEFMAAIKNWWNVEINVEENLAIISFLKDSVFQKPVVDHSHLEIPDPKYSNNNNRLYKLEYANGDKVFYNKDGQIFTDLSDKSVEEQKIEMKAWPAIVEGNRGVVTAVAPEDEDSLSFCLYDGPVNGVPICNPSIATDFSLQKVFKNFWENWLNFRVNSYSYKENFECSVFEEISVKARSHKYHESHLLKEVKKKYLSETTMSVDIESETF
ncbi:hypothetical protein MG296_10470 [Flavobacteriaceae bacterium TK19130]|nr:hypothetical protein [Thermobacterium salinum]